MRFFIKADPVEVFLCIELLSSTELFMSGCGLPTGTLEPLEKANWFRK